MFDEFRTAAKATAQNNGLTYADIAVKTDISESSIKLFMCGASDSRRVAEKVADALGLSILYHDGDFKVLQKEGV